jgi:hypothetical protein
MKRDETIHTMEALNKKTTIKSIDEFVCVERRSNHHRNFHVVSKNKENESESM